MVVWCGWIGELLPGNNRLLNLGYCARGGRNLASVGNVNAALLVNGLRWQIDEVSGTCTCGLPGGKQSTRRRFKNRYIEDVANTHNLVRLWTLVRECARERNQIGLRQEADRISAHIDQCVRQRRRGPKACCSIPADSFA